jgi:branched-chain amino acid transport system substrate-binding protein
MTSKAWRLTMAAAVAAGSFALAACGGSDDKGGGSSTGGGGGSGGTKANLADCKFTFGVMAPITGDAASIGQEQLNWAKYSVTRFNQANGTKFAIEEGDTQLDPGQASTVAQQLVSNNAVKAIVGPAGSQEVEAVGPVFDRAQLAYVSPSATRTDLAGGKYKNFARVVPSDAVQGPTDAAYLADTLSAKKVLIVDDQTSYSTGLADEVEKGLKDKGVNVSRTSVRRSQTDFSAVISSKVSGDTDYVFLPWQIAANAQQFGEQLKEQNKSAKIFGSDGLYSPDDFKIEGAMVSAFAPDITSISSSKTVADGYRAKYGSFGTFGPPVYVASEVVMTAAKNVCAGGNNDPSRGDVSDAIKKVSLADSILGQPIAFEADGNVKDAKFFIFTVKGGKFAAADGQS